MKIKQLLTKTLLVAAGLLWGGVNSVWADTETVNVLSENYESYSAGDITATMVTNGWTFQSKNNKNQVTIVQGTGTAVNLTKYFDFYYPDGGANRNQRWDFGVTSSLNADNWTLTFSAALNPGAGNSGNKFYVTGTSSGNVTTAYTEVTNPFFALKATESAGVIYKPTIGATTYDDELTLASGTWFKYTISATNINTEAKTADIYVKITSYDGLSTIWEKTVTGLNTASIGTLRGLCWDSPRQASRLNLDDVLLTKEVDASVCANPTYVITGPSGTSRKFTLACETAGSVIYYATSELAKDAAGWTTYSSEVTTDAATIYAYAKKGSVTSEIINFATGAGTAITLNAPTITVSNMIANGALYNARFDAWYNTAGVEFTPSATLSATFTPEGGSATDVVLPYTVTEKGTLKVTSSAAGFTSAEAEISVPALYAQSWQSLDFSSLTGTDAVQAALDAEWTQQAGHGRWSSWADGSYNFYQHGSASASTITVNEKLKMREVVLLVEGRGLGRNISGGENISVTSSTGDIIGFEVYNGYGADINKGVNTYKSYRINLGGNPSVSTNNGALLVQATIFSDAPSTVPVTIPSSGLATISSAYPLDCGHLPSGLTAYKVTATSATSATVAPVTEAVAAGTGLILEGTAGSSYNIPVVASGSTIGGNLLHAAVNETLLDDGTFYILYEGKFVLVKDAETALDRTVPAGKAYLLASEVTAPELSLSFDNLTGIRSIENGKLTMDNVIYDLQGRKVANPTKGLYIVNGKKTIIK